MNLDRQIKRNVVARRHHFFAVTVPGLETICRHEIGMLSDGVKVESEEAGGVVFSGRLTDLYLANLHLRTAGRILLRLDTFKATNFRELSRKAGAVAWALYLPWGHLPACKVSAHHSRLYHTGAVAQRVEEAIASYWRDLGSEPKRHREQTLFVRLDHDVATLSLDSSGPNLYQRGLKSHRARAPLRETLAAGILHLADYRPGRPLLDPMCGAGTFSLEAALMAKQIPPGSQRDFAFMQWPAFRVRQWQHLKKVARQTTAFVEQPSILASDSDSNACRHLTDCLRRNQLDDAVEVRHQDFFGMHLNDTPFKKPGLVVLNPPYGQRLSLSEPLDAFYQRIGDKLRRDFGGWRAALIVPKPDLRHRIAFPLTPTPIVHGGLELTLLVGPIP